MKCRNRKFILDFPKMLWISEYLFFNNAIFAKNSEEYETLIEDFVCEIQRARLGL